MMQDSTTQDTVTINLEHPIQHGTETIASINLIPIKAKHLRDISTDLNMRDCLTLLGKISGHPPSVIDELSAPDLSRLLEQVAVFFGSGLKTGHNV